MSQHLKYEFHDLHVYLTRGKMFMVGYNVYFEFIQCIAT